MSSRTIPVLFFFALSAACGGSIDILPDGGGNPDGGGGPDATPGPDCPAQAPSEGAACSKEGIECEYGGDPRWVCNTVSRCSGGHWSVGKEGDPSCPTAPVNPPPCPGSYAEAQQGGACSPNGTICNYSTSSATQFCTCNVLGGPIELDGGGAVWYCGQPYDPSCPAERPRVGSSCSVPAVHCSYDVCGLPSGLAVDCSEATGTWVTSPGEVCASAQ